MALNSSTAGVVPFPSIQLLAIEMLLHFLMGPQVLDFAKQNKLVLSLGITNFIDLIFLKFISRILKNLFFKKM